MCPGLAPPEKRRERPSTSSRIYSRRGQLRPALALGAPLCLSISPWRGQAAHTNTGCLLSGAHEHPPRLPPARVGKHAAHLHRPRRATQLLCTHHPSRAGNVRSWCPFWRKLLQGWGGGEHGTRWEELVRPGAVHEGRGALGTRLGFVPSPFPPVPTRSHIPPSPGKPRHSKRL